MAIFFPMRIRLKIFGVQLKKGVIYAEFDKGAMAIKSARREKAWKFFSTRTY